MVVELAGGVPAAPAQPPGGSAEPAKPQIPPPPAPRKEPRESSFQDLAPKRTGEKKKPPKEENREEPSAAPAVEGPPVPSPGGVVAGPGGAQGSGADGITALDLGDAEFAWYRGSVTAALRSRWIRPVLEDTEDTIAATVAFEVRRDGTVQDVRVEVSSGVPAMDRSVLRAVIEASPLPPLPSSWREPTLPARFEFRWHPGEPE
jgi:TonB family protein